MEGPASRQLAGQCQTMPMRLVFMPAPGYWQACGGPDELAIGACPGQIARAAKLLT